MDKNIKSKGLMDYIKEDTSLSKKLTYEEFTQTNSGFDDSGIEEAYNTYKKLKKETGIEGNGLMDYIKDDPSLSRKLTYEEFTQTKSGFDDSGIEEAFNTYYETLKGIDN